MRNRKRKPIRRPDKTESQILAGKQMIIDSKLGYTVIPETYENIAKKIEGNKNNV